MKESSTSAAKLRLVTSMVIFGTVGLVRRLIPYSSAMVAFFRGLIGTLLIVAIYLVQKRKLDKAAIRRNLLILCASGAMIGFNWILLFEAYRYTTVSVATICYYMAPVFTIIASPFVLKEKITLQKGLCALVALVGMVLVSEVLTTGVSGLTGVFFGLGAAFLYACVVILNKFIKGLSDMDRTIFQLGPAAIAVLPYWLLTDNLGALKFDALGVVMLVLAGIVNTGIAYALYFGSIKDIPAQTAALFSYIDPAIAVLLSAFVLKEGMSVSCLVGVILVLGAAIVSELNLKAGAKSRS